MPNRILFFFIDGIGLGEAGSYNPFTTSDLKGFGQLSRRQTWDSNAHPVQKPGSTFKSIDATLGVEGLPQSGTGQSTIFTGVNCAELVGRHFGPYPHTSTREVIAERNIFKQVTSTGMEAAFANAYPPSFFEKAKKQDRWTVTTRCCLDAGVRLRTIADLEAGQAVAADLTGAGLRTGLGLPIDVRSEAEAAERMFALADAHRFTLFEYFHTDKAGHAQSLTDARRYIESLDKFFLHLVRLIKGTDVSLVVTSDHGNVEDLRIKTHTMNQVPLAVFGKAAPMFYEVESLTDITPAILHSLVP